MHVLLSIVSRRCDEPMRRSKEKCITPFYRPWRCTEDCRNCFCCIQMDENGTESHVNVASHKRYKDEC